MEIKVIDKDIDSITIPIHSELDDAHIEELAKRDRILFQLNIMIGNLEIPTFYRRWLSETYDFIKEGGVRI